MDQKKEHQIELLMDLNLAQNWAPSLEMSLEKGWDPTKAQKTDRPMVSSKEH
jgi:hypothetical protein